MRDARKVKDRFLGHYEDWRTVRVAKIISIFGEDYFKDKTLLELGCGLGYIGMEFHSLGAKVTLAEGRQEHVDEIKKQNPDIEAICLDQDGTWNLHRRFDIILHFGVLYHLKNWRADLKSTLNHSNLVILESEVANRTAADFELFREEEGYDQALNGTAARTSAAAIEKELINLGSSFTRYDDADLNTHKGHVYNWKVNDDGPEWLPMQRRFWVINNKQHK